MQFRRQFLADELQIEKDFPAPPADELKASGYDMVRMGALDEETDGVWGNSELIAIDPITGELAGGHDWRHHFGKAAGY